MTQSLQTAAPALLDTLIQAGDRVLSPDEASRVQDAALAIGAAAVNTALPANSILASLRPLLVDKVGVMAEAFEKLAVDSLEGMDTKYSKETVMTLYPTLLSGQKLLIWFLALALVAFTGVALWDVLQQPQVDRTDVLLTVLVPLGGLIAFAAVPIKTLAYSSLAITAKVVEHKMNKASTK
ncbi:hypothetical protein WELLINGTON_106 [Erwinia phage Wellington]|jgi:hypothetical protein|uniref:Uncharacterized protein n=1 Tax=Erwinia phage Wellington TaxID=2267653 RepID=A0A345BLB5_9CAUD|nr:hypothetical protein HOT70_gp195 [Erwinia phage Wellington]AXF51236.1 hypothetical protein WELLINGTON_106 [Erwinia phage Wellington]